MLKERLNQLFTTFDPSIQALISEVLLLEQEHISMDKPRLKEHIDQIISRLAAKELNRNDKSKDESRNIFE